MLPEICMLRIADKSSTMFCVGNQAAPRAPTTTHFLPFVEEPVSARRDTATPTSLSSMVGEARLASSKLFCDENSGFAGAHFSPFLAVADTDILGFHSGATPFALIDMAK